MISRKIVAIVALPFCSLELDLGQAQTWNAHSLDYDEDAFQYTLNYMSLDRNSTFKAVEYPKWQSVNSAAQTTIVPKDVKDKVITGESPKRLQLDCVF